MNTVPAVPVYVVGVTEYMAGRLPAVIIPVKLAPLIAGRVPVKFCAGKSVKLDPLP